MIALTIQNITSVLLMHSIILWYSRHPTGYWCLWTSHAWLSMHWPASTPSAWNTKFSWVLAGRTRLFHVPTRQEITSHVCLFYRCTKLSEKILGDRRSIQTWRLLFSLEKKAVVQHFKDTLTHLKDGAFAVPLPKKPGVRPLGKLRSQVVRWFVSLEN